MLNRFNYLINILAYDKYFGNRLLLNNNYFVSRNIRYFHYKIGIYVEMLMLPLCQFKIDAKGLI
jgi:hypothetical protein